MTDGATVHAFTVWQTDIPSIVPTTQIYIYLSEIINKLLI